ncbi:hypothetical protein DEO72_LG10g2208 [Vigna unguiculata]|uniref:Secreted protein n=1 Tax=Vigna unguiculata TaxID=3917 RepID=A0A4D6NFL8_VIGUN|nr:hypothetical protein DEO72_LG10g2208 [Vigna unguiculata]
MLNGILCLLFMAALKSIKGPGRLFVKGALMNENIVRSLRESSVNLKSLPLRLLVDSTEQSTFGGRSPANGARFRQSMAPMASSSGIQSHSFLDHRELSILRLISAISSFLFNFRSCSCAV